MNIQDQLKGISWRIFGQNLPPMLTYKLGQGPAFAGKGGGGSGDRADGWNFVYRGRAGYAVKFAL